MAAVLTEAGRGAARSRRPTWPLLAVLVGGALVAVSLGAYAGLHAPARRETVSLFFSGTLPFKAWTTTAILGLTVFQAVSALRLYGRLSWPRELPAWLGGAHRLSGTLAFIASLPVASTVCGPWDWRHRRTSGGFAHALLGCACYGVVVVKVSRRRGRGHRHGAGDARRPRSRAGRRHAGRARLRHHVRELSRPDGGRPHRARHHGRRHTARVPVTPPNDRLGRYRPCRRAGARRGPVTR